MDIDGLFLLGFEIEPLNVRIDPVDYLLNEEQLVTGSLSSIPIHLSKLGGRE